MRRILKQHELVADQWHYLGEDGVADGGALIIPFAELRKSTVQWLARPGLLGVKLTSAENVTELTQYLPKLALVAVEFPNAGDGRGYSYGRILRSHLHFQGEVRAIGAGVKQDQVFLMARCGFDSFELNPAENLDEARAALERYSVAYQPAEPLEAIRQQRYFANGAA